MTSMTTLVKLVALVAAVTVFACLLGVVVGVVAAHAQRADTERDNRAVRAAWIGAGIDRLESMANHPSNRDGAA